MADKIDPAVIAHGFAQLAGGNAADYLQMTGVSPEIEKQKKETAWQAAKSVSPLSVGGRIAASEAAFGIPEMIANKTMTDEDKEKWEAAKEAHPLAATIGGVGGTAANMLGIAGIEALTAGAATPAIAAAKGAQAAGKVGKIAELTKKLPWLKDALTQAKVGAAVSAPHAIGTTVLGEGDIGERIGQAGTELLLGGGLGAAAGAIPQGILPAVKRSNAMRELSELAGTGGRGNAQIRNRIYRIAPVGEGDTWLKETADIVNKGKKEFGLGAAGFGSVENEAKFIRDLGEKSGQRFEKFYAPLKERGYKPDAIFIANGKTAVDPITEGAAEAGQEMTARSAINNIKDPKERDSVFAALKERENNPSELNKYITSLQHESDPELYNAGKIMRNNFHADLDKFAKEHKLIDSSELKEARKQYAQYKLIETLGKRKMPSDISAMFGGSDTAPALAFAEGDAGKTISAGVGKAVSKLFKPAAGKIMDVAEKPLEFIGKHPAAVGRLAPVVADQMGLTEKQTPQAPVKKWYENPKAGQALLPILQQKYQTAMDAGIYPPGFTFEQFAARAKEKTNDFDPRRVAKWIYKDPIARGDFIKQVEDFEKIKNIDVGKVASYKPKALKALMQGLSKLPIVGGVAGAAGESGAKEQFDAMVSALAHKVGGEKQARVLIKQVINSQASPEAKKTLLLKMFGLGEESYAAQMGIV